MKIKSYIDPVFKNEVWVFTGATNKTIVAAAKKLKLQLETPTADTWRARCFFKGGTGAVLFFKDVTPPAHIVAHEALHVVVGVLDFINCSKLTFDNDEIYAYYLEYHVREINWLIGNNS